MQRGVPVAWPQPSAAELRETWGAAEAPGTAGELVAAAAEPVAAQAVPAAELLAVVAGSAVGELRRSLLRWCGNRIRPRSRSRLLLGSFRVTLAAERLDA